MSMSSLEGEEEEGVCTMEEALKRHCVIENPNPNFTSGTKSSIFKRPSSLDASSGTSAEGTGGSIFEILAGRKALKCPCEADIVNSASATAGKKMRHSEDLGQYVGENPRDASERRSRHRSERYQRILMKRQQQGGITKSRPKKSVIMSPEDLPMEILPSHPFFVENPSSASATAADSGTKAGGFVRKLPEDYSGYVYDASEVRYQIAEVGGRRVKEIIGYRRPFMTRPVDKQQGGISTSSWLMKSGVFPPQNLPWEFLKDTPYYKEAIAAGDEVIMEGNSWTIKRKGNVFYTHEI